MSDQSTPLAGTEYILEGGGYFASVMSVGASLRRLHYRGRNLVLPYELNELRPHYRGAILAPWPNRVIDGRYRFGGREYQLPLTEPARGHALHGLLAWAAFHPIEQSAERIVLAATIEPQAGYPWRVEVQVEYAVSESGLHTTVRATNHSTKPAPFGTGPHPYLLGGNDNAVAGTNGTINPSGDTTGKVDDWVLSLPAASVITTNGPRLLPGDTLPVPPELSFREPRPVGTVFIDHAYGDLEPAENGLTTVTVTDAAGCGSGIRWGRDCPWVQVHTADQPDAALSRRGLAVEPMTCPPDAFNTGQDLLVLHPGSSSHAGWEIFAIS